MLPSISLCLPAECLC